MTLRLVILFEHVGVVDIGPKDNKIMTIISV